jgi:hypothetical protein
MKALILVVLLAGCHNAGPVDVGDTESDTANYDMATEGACPSFGTCVLGDLYERHMNLCTEYTGELPCVRFAGCEYTSEPFAEICAGNWKVSVHA